MGRSARGSRLRRARERSPQRARSSVRSASATTISHASLMCIHAIYGTDMPLVCLLQSITWMDHCVKRKNLSYATARYVNEYCSVPCMLVSDYDQGMYRHLLITLYPPIALVARASAPLAIKIGPRLTN